jgi:hypothetical protein
VKHFFLPSDFLKPVPVPRFVRFSSGFNGFLVVYLASGFQGLTGPDSFPVHGSTGWSGFKNIGIYTEIFPNFS